MPLKTIDLKFTTKICVLSFFFCAFTTAYAQNKKAANQQKDSLAQTTDTKVLLAQATPQKDSTTSFQRYKIDGVAAVVGNYLVLESDIKKLRIDIKNRMQGRAADITNCQLMSQLLKNKLLAHAAKQDSTVYGMISDARIRNQVDRQVDQLVRRLGDMEKVLSFYRKDSESELRQDLFKIDKRNQLAQAMKKNITEDVSITPEEVHEFFENIPDDQLPEFGDEVEIAQLIIKPKVPQSEIDKVINRLNEIRSSIVNDGASFVTKAVLYSEGALSSNGGRMVISRNDPLDKTFKQVAYSLRKGEVSEPFKSTFGYHILKVEKILGQKRVIRHIILMPDLTKEALAEAKAKVDSIRTLIVDGKMSFTEAAKKFSDDEETRGDGGQLINPATGDTHFQLTKIDPKLFNVVNSLEQGEVSNILTEESRSQRKFFKLLTVTAFYPEHTANYAKDYPKIKRLALERKKMEAIKEWRQKTIKNTYIKISDNYKDCAFKANWLKE